MRFVMERKKLAFLVVSFLLVLSACGGDDTAPANPPGNNGDAQAGNDAGSRQDAAPLVDVVRDGTSSSDADAGSIADAGVPGDAALEAEAAVGAGTGLCNKAH